MKYIANWLEGMELNPYPLNADKGDKMELYKHNKKFFNQILKAFKSGKNKVAYISATGTGKSYVASGYIDYHIKHDTSKKKILIVVHRLSLMSQWQELLINCGENIDYITYHKFSRKSTEIDYIISNYNLIIFDEFHHLGAKIWGKKAVALYNAIDQHAPETKVIGLSATSYRYDINLNVADEFFDTTVDGYNIQSAIDDGIINQYEYVPVLFKLKDDVSDLRLEMKNRKLDPDDYRFSLIDKLDLELSKYNMKNIVRKKLLYKNAKIAVFVESIAAIDDGVDLIKSIFDDVDIHIYIIHSGLPKESNTSTLDEFKHDKKLSCLISVNMFDEGIHIDKINTIFLLRKTKSPNLYFQQIGRGFGYNNDKLIIFDFVSNYINIFHTIGKAINKEKKNMNNIRDFNERDEYEKLLKSKFQIVDKEAINILVDLNTIWESLKETMWTDEMTDALIYLRNNGTPYKEIAKILNISIVSVTYKCNRLLQNNIIKSRMSDTWTQEKKDTLVEMMKNGKSYAEISDAIDIPINLVSAKGYYVLKHNPNIKYAYSTAEGWTDEQVKKLIRLRKEGKSRDEIAMLIGRSVYSVGSKIEKLRRTGELDSVHKMIVTDEKIEELIKLRNQGKGYTEISEIMGIKVRLVKSWIIKLIKAGRITPIPRKIFKEEMLDEMIRLREEGESYTKISRVMDINVSSVKRELKKLGL